MQAMRAGYTLSEPKFAVDLELSNSLLSETGENIGMHDLQRVVAESPSVNSMSQSRFCSH